MPIVTPNTALRQALTNYIEAKGCSKAAIAAEFGMSPMTIGRFLKSGRVIDVNKGRIEVGLNRAGFWQQDPTTSHSEVFLLDSDKVIKVLEFLLAAARQHAKRSSGNPKRG